MKAGPWLVPVAAVAVGAAAALAGGAGLKWALVPLGLLLLPFGWAALGSTRRLLLGLLVVSLCVHVDVNLGYTQGFTVMRMGVPVTLTSLVLLFGILHMFRLAWKGEFRLRFYPAVLVPYAAVALWAGLSGVWARAPERVVHGFPLALEGLLLLWFLANSIRDEEDARYVAGMMALAVGISGVFALAQVATNSSLGMDFLGEMEGWRPSGRYSRATGLWNNPNNLAFFLSGWLPLLFLGSVWGGKRWFRWGCLAGGLLGVAGLVFTQSRGGWASVVLASALGFVWAGRGRKREEGEEKKQGVGKALPLVVGLLVLAIPLLPVVIYRVGQDLGSLKGREQLIPPAFRMIGSHPLAGVGLDNYRVMVGWYDDNPPTRPDGSPEAVHNIYLQTAAELGVPALLLLALAVGLAMRMGARGIRRVRGDLALVGVGAFAGLVAVLLHGMGELGTIWHPKFRTIPFLCGVLLAVWGASRGGGEEEDSPPV